MKSLLLKLRLPYLLKTKKMTIPSTYFYYLSGIVTGLPFSKFPGNLCLLPSPEVPDIAKINMRCFHVTNSGKYPSRKETTS